MNTLRELVLILSTFLWIGAGIWIAVHIVASDPAVSGENAKEMAPVTSYYIFAIGVAAFVLTTYFWKKKKDP